MSSFRRATSQQRQHQLQRKSRAPFRALRLELLERRELLTTFTVTDAGNSGAGTLRQAIIDAGNTNDGIADLITIDSSLSNQTINLTSELVIDGGGNGGG